MRDALERITREVLQAIGDGRALTPPATLLLLRRYLRLGDPSLRAPLAAALSGGIDRSAGDPLWIEPLAEAARAVMLERPPTEFAPGALILFRMRTGAVAKHCGIVTSSDRFIHAYERSGVVEAPLDASWRRRIAFAFLFPSPS